MNEVALIQALRTDSEVKRILEYDFDFRSVPVGTQSSLFQFTDGTGYELVGTDASGGEYALCDRKNLPTCPLLYVSSEGQAGVIARSLQDGLATIVDLPYFHDCLKFSGNGQLAEMRRVVPLSESDLLAETPQIVSIRKTLQKRLDIPPILDVILELHLSLTELSPLYSVCGTDGWPFETLFGKFTVMSNAEWRRRLTHRE